MRRRPSRAVLEEIRDRRTRAFSKDELELGIPRPTDEPPTVKLYVDPGNLSEFILNNPPRRLGRRLLFNLR